MYVLRDQLFKPGKHKWNEKEKKEKYCTAVVNRSDEVRKSLDSFNGHAHKPGFINMFRIK
jgi:hypothetical protein